MTSSTISFEVKSQLAKLLATENIILRHSPNSKTAYFNTETRELVLPVWQNISEDLYDMLVVHEVGHALDTPSDKWVQAIDDIASEHYDDATIRQKIIIKNFLNIVEDARIDKRQKRRYPGSRRNYNIGYKELHDRDFFGVSKKDINTLPFIDRANIWFKHGFMYNIKFTSEEQALIKRMEALETFDEVITLTTEVYGFCVDELKKKKEDEKKLTLDDVEASEFNEDSLSDDELDDIIFDEATEEEDDDQNQSPTSGDADEEKSSEMSPAYSDDQDKKETDASALSLEDELDPITEKAAQEAVKSIVVDDEYCYVYLNTPNMCYKNIIDDYKVVMNDMENEVKRILGMGNYYKDRLTESRKALMEFRLTEKDSISFMVKEFEMYKSADEYTRTSISKTGVIDTNKLFSYKYNDDIFRRLSVVSTGKNHGFVIILDWSGSMLANLQQTIKQLFGLVMFCKRVQVPFEVYLFRDHYFGGRQSVTMSPKTDNISFDEFKLRNILSSRMNLTTLNKAFEYLWLTANHFYFQCDAMNNTPLNQAILATDHIVNEFRKKNKLQVVNTVFLTDGVSDSIHVNWRNINTNRANKKGYRYFIHDHITKKNFYLGPHTNTYNTTEVFLKILKERTNSNVIGFYITSSLRTPLSSLGVDHSLHDTLVKKWKADNYVGIQTAGYDEYYLINIRNMNIDDNPMNINSNMTKKAILKEFKNFSGRKTGNRVLLSKFIQRVCKAA